MIKVKLPFWERWSYFNHWGVNDMFGLSYLTNDGSSYSFAGGLVAKDLLNIDNDTGVHELTATLVWTAGFFTIETIHSWLLSFCQEPKDIKYALIFIQDCCILEEFLPDFSSTFEKTTSW
ncbi:MAG: hypothetical protein EH225_09785 [Calditrichaeota bacterium]|nr:hypothetical protein [Calditrichota bacterium]RQW01129.1 MAG: hypothetical protein EH225_09785 [Calditrichota bacterium]